MSTYFIDKKEQIEHSSDEEEIVYNPKKMLENSKQRFYMSFSQPKRRNIQQMWNRLSDIICSPREREFSKFLNKVQVMQKLATPKEIESKKKQLKFIANKKRTNISFYPQSSNNILLQIVKHGSVSK